MSRGGKKFFFFFFFGVGGAEVCSVLVGASFTVRIGCPALVVQIFGSRSPEGGFYQRSNALFLVLSVPAFSSARMCSRSLRGRTRLYLFCKRWAEVLEFLFKECLDLNKVLVQVLGGG